jgi:hypothetical protein
MNNCFAHQLSWVTRVSIGNIGRGSVCLPKLKVYLPTYLLRYATSTPASEQSLITLEMERAWLE